MPPSRPRPHLVAAGGAVAGRPGVAVIAAAAVGLVTMLAGTFAPWLASGSSERNLYSSAGVVQRLAGLRAPLTLVLDALPLAGLYCVLAGVAYVMGRRRIAAGALGLLALVLGCVAGAALTHRKAGSVHLLATGPGLTFVGAVLSIVAIAVAAASSHHGAATASAPDRTFARPPEATQPVPTEPATGPEILPTDGHAVENRTTMEFR